MVINGGLTGYPWKRVCGWGWMAGEERFYYLQEFFPDNCLLVTMWRIYKTQQMSENTYMNSHKFQLWNEILGE